MVNLLYRQQRTTMKDKKTLSIGIPAFNEQGNIERVLRAVLEQVEENYTLKEILVMSDGSTDETVRKASQVCDARIQIIDSKKRLGKSARLQEICRKFDADLLLLIDADITITDTMLFEKIVAGVPHKKFGLLGVNALPLTSRTYFERIIESGVMIMKETAEKWRNGNNYLSFKGCFLVLDRSFAKSITFPETLVNNDAYLYFAAVEKGYTPAYLKNAKVFYRSPSTLSDHMKQAARFAYSRKELELYFNLDWQNEYQLPIFISAQSTLKHVFLKPQYTLPYLWIHFLGNTKSLLFKSHLGITSTWVIAASTK